MTDAVFNTQASDGNSTSQPDTNGDSQTYDFIGEGKQYANKDVALASIPHKDKHIANIENENAEMRAKLAESSTINDVMSAIKTGGQDDTANVEQQNNTTSSSDVADIVKSVLQSERAQEAAENNAKRANEFMMKKFGDKAQDVANSKAAELGMDFDSLQALAISSPNAYEALFTEQTSQEQQRPTSGGAHVPSSSVQASEGQASFSELRKADPAKFLSPEVQNEMMRQAMANPEKYFNAQ